MLNPERASPPFDLLSESAPKLRAYRFSPELGVSFLGDTDISGAGLQAESKLDAGFVVGGGLGFFVDCRPLRPPDIRSPNSHRFTSQRYGHVDNYTWVNVANPGQRNSNLDSSENVCGVERPIGQQKRDVGSELLPVC